VICQQIADTPILVTHSAELVSTRKMNSYTIRRLSRRVMTSHIIETLNWRHTQSKSLLDVKAYYGLLEVTRLLTPVNADTETCQTSLGLYRLGGPEASDSHRKSTEIGRIVCNGLLWAIFNRFLQKSTHVAALATLIIASKLQH